MYIFDLLQKTIRCNAALTKYIDINIKCYGVTK